MKKEIIKLDNFGRGITYVDGMICFVDDALPGEEVKIKIFKRTKKYLLGEVIDYYRLSDDRVSVKCRYNDVCGGCNLEHLSENSEKKFKCNKVKDILKKFGDVDGEKIENIVSENLYGYRNKITLHGDGTCLGFYSKGSNNIISIENCLLATDKINEIIDVLNKMTSTEKIMEAVIRTSNDNSEVMLSLKGEINNYEQLQNIVDVLEINGEVLLGEGHILSEIGKMKYYVSNKSFFQVNNKLTEKLYDEVFNLVKKIKPKKVLDLYCGTGTIGLYISSLVGAIVGVDYSESGIKDAINNAKLNKLENCRFICDKVENVIDKFEDFDLIIVDPPRAGLDNKTIEYLKKINAKDIIYVSCDPATLGRDLKVLSDTYNVEKVKPFNMFPRTYHVECVSVLHRKNIKK